MSFGGCVVLEGFLFDSESFLVGCGVFGGWWFLCLLGGFMFDDSMEIDSGWSMNSSSPI